MATCASCGQANPEIARFCLACGTELPSAAPEVRKTVSLLFADVVGSTALAGKLDAEAVRSLMTTYAGAARSVVEKHGGTIEKFVGDAVMAVFGIPVVHEDDALRAVRAAEELRETVRALAEEVTETHGASFGARIGVNTGEVIAGDPSSGHGFVSGDPVNVAARLEQSAGPGEVLLGATTYALVRDAVKVEPVEPLELKGKAERVPAFRLTSVDAAAAGVRRLGGAPLVGRERELHQLIDTVEDALAKGKTELVTVLGTAGAGKSRLTTEAVEVLSRRARVLQGRCLPYGDGITYWPIIQIVREAARITDDDPPEGALSKLGAVINANGESRMIRDHVAGLLNLVDVSGDVRETFWALRRFFESLAEDTPLVLVLDDLHWAEPTFLDLVEYLADFQQAAVSLVCLARPDLLEERPDWGSGRANVSHIRLTPLDEEQSHQLVAGLLGGTHLPERLVQRITAAAEGNPLFVEETIRMLVDEGVVTADGTVAPGVVEEIALPPTIDALLSARLDQLSDDEKKTMQAASIVGQEFWWGAAAELLGPSASGSLASVLRSLARKELIRPATSTFAGEDAFRFAHILIRDAAYNSLPKELRADYHERFAGWLERHAGESSQQYEEILAYHLESAVTYRRDLGRPVTDELVQRASGSLASAGRRAKRRGDVVAAVSLLQRASNVLPTNHPARLPILPDLAHVHMRHGDYGQAEALLHEAIRLAQDAGQSLIEAMASVHLISLQLERGEKTGESGLEELQRHIDVLESLGDEALPALGAAWNTVTMTWSILARDADAELESAQKALNYARRAGDRLAETEAIMSMCVVWTFGPTSTAEAYASCRKQLDDASDNPAAVGALHATLAHILAMMGRFDEARVAGAAGVEIFRDAGMLVHMAAILMPLGQLELLANDPVAAEKLFRECCDTLRSLDSLAYLSTAAAMLAEALFRLDRIEEADEWTRVAESTGASDDASTQCLYRVVRAKIRARQGVFEEAHGLLQEADAFAHFPIEQGEASLALLEVLLLSGDTEGARAAGDAAIAVFERKGDVASVGRARRELERVAQRASL